MKKNAYAKINLTLEIIKQHTYDEYHEIKSIFQEISLHDEVYIEKNVETKITFNPPISVTISSVHKAVKLFEEEIKREINVIIKIGKNIPEQSGLGGGSSDAATVLKTLNEIYKNPLDKERLTKIGLKIGADVPFFLVGHRAKVEGIGEKVLPVKDTKLFGIVAVPEFKKPTKTAYSLADKLKYRDKGDYTERIIEAAQNNETILPYFYNHFEKVYERFSPEYKLFKNKIWQITSRKFHLTGSGSAMFFLSYNEAEVKDAFRKLTNNRIEAIIVKTI